MSSVEYDYNKKIAGSLLGGFLADSIGFLFEGHSQQYINQFLPLIKDYTISKYCRGYDKTTKLNGPQENTTSCSWFKNFGQYTDDSQLTYAVIETINKNNGLFSYDNYAKEIVKLFNTKKIVGYGSSTVKFVENYNRGMNYQFSGKSGTTSNGSLMRSDIFGLLFFNNKELLKKVVLTQSMMTHMSSECAATSLASATVISYLMTHKKFEDDELLYKLYLTVKDINVDVANAILNMKQIIKLDFEEAYRQIKTHQTIDWGSKKLSSCAITTFMWALYSFLTNKNNYMDCIINCYKVGGDVDTIAKIAGAYSGCYLGKQCLPKELLEHLQDGDKKLTDITDNIKQLIHYIKHNKITVE